MNDEQIKTLASSPLVTIGSHGWQHNNLGNIEKDHAGWELRQSKEYLENLTQNCHWHNILMTAIRILC
jgi:peptidoglycan/xylan/chitin deacetylase (PgdA/CDA1 family)